MNEFLERFCAKFVEDCGKPHTKEGANSSASISVYDTPGDKDKMKDDKKEKDKDEDMKDEDKPKKKGKKKNDKEDED